MTRHELTHVQQTQSIRVRMLAMRAWSMSTLGFTRNLYEDERTAIALAVGVLDAKLSQCAVAPWNEDWDDDEALELAEDVCCDTHALVDAMELALTDDAAVSIVYSLVECTLVLERRMKAMGVDEALSRMERVATSEITAFNAWMN